ncbi:MAG: hypothetical protein M3115_02365 [Thermoproteota archaeon]|nr:hypothetical protein [Thermoproteota archaeon]
MLEIVNFRIPITLIVVAATISTSKVKVLSVDKSWQEALGYSLVLVASLFIVQNIVIVIFWSNLYMAGPTIKNIVDAAAPYLFAINAAQSAGLAILLWIS